MAATSWRMLHCCRPLFHCFYISAIWHILNASLKTPHWHLALALVVAASGAAHVFQELPGRHGGLLAANTHFEPRCSKFCQKDGMQTQSSYVELGRLGTLWYDAYVALAANLSLTCRLTQLNETKTEQDKVNQCKTLALNLKQWSWPQCIFPHTMESAWPLKGSPLPLRGSPLP